MNRFLFFKDRAIRYLLPWLGIGLIIGVFLSASSGAARPVDSSVPAGPDFNHYGWAILVVWMHAGLYLLFGGLIFRSDPFYLALPVSTRKLWLFRMAAILLGMLAILLASLVFTALGNQIKGVQPVLYPAIIEVVVQLWILSFLALVAAQRFRLKVNEIVFNARVAVLLFLLWLVMLVLFFVLRSLPFWVSIVPLLGGVCLAVDIYRNLPAAFVINAGGFQWAAGKKSARSTKERTRSYARWGLVEMIILKMVFLNRASLFILIWVVFVASIGADYYYSGLNHLSMIMFVWVAMNALMMASISKMHMLDSLPISRRKLFAFSVLPAFFVIALTYTLSMAIFRGNPAKPLVTFIAMGPNAHLDIQVPYEYWEISRDADLQPVNPEQDNRPYAGWVTSVYKGSGLLFYSPYHVPADSSPAFAAEQLSRAVADIYGRVIPADELENRYFVQQADGSLGFKVEQVVPVMDYPDLRPQGWKETLPLVIFLVGCPGFLVMAVTLRGYRMGTHVFERVLVYFVLVLLMAVIVLGLLWASNAGYTDDWKFTALISIGLQKIVGVLPGSVLLHWIMTFVLLAGSYAVAEYQYMRITMPPEQRSEA